MAMKFSVVIPAYNASATIAATLGSCFQQTYKPAEIIVVDDGSTDNTLEILRSFSADIKLVSLGENKGVSFARNAGWAAASGDYILFLDSDDLFHSRKIEILNDVLTRNAGIKFLYHHYTLEPFEAIGDHDAQPQAISFASLLLRNPAATPCICVSREISTRFKEAFRYCEDHEFVLNTAYYYGCSAIPLKLARLHHAVLSGSGLSARRWKMRMGEMKMYAMVWRYNPLLLPLVPFLLLLSFGKHLWKKLSFVS